MNDPFSYLDPFPVRLASFSIGSKASATAKQFYPRKFAMRYILK